MHHSKKISALIFIVLCLVSLCLFSFKEKNNDTSETVIVRCTQIASFGGKSSAIRIYYGNEQGESIDLDAWALGNEGDNYDKITTVLNRLNSEGYEIVSASETMFGTNGFVNTFILKRK